MCFWNGMHKQQTYSGGTRDPPETRREDVGGGGGGGGNHGFTAKEVSCAVITHYTERTSHYSKPKTHDKSF